MMWIACSGPIGQTLAPIRNGWKLRLHASWHPSGLTTGDVPAADQTYLAQQVATRMGLSEADAQKRVENVIVREKVAAAKAKQTADMVRKATSELAIFTALAMLIGAFIASASAAHGGSLRDEY